jgi:RNA polymerase sigma-70 factor (ECF subfamily)
VVNDSTSEPARWLAEHGDALYAYCLLRVRERATAERLVEEALVAATSAVPTFDAEADERGWLIGILKSRILEHLRQLAVGRPLDVGRNPSENVDKYFDETGRWDAKVAPWPEPAEAVQREYFWNHYHDCIEKLPERLRILYALKELDHLANEEVLDTLNIDTEDNLQVMLARARLHLARCLQGKTFKD